MLLGAPNQLLLLVALGGLIGPVGSIESVESNGIPRRRMEDNTPISATRLEGLVGPVGLCC